MSQDQESLQQLRKIFLTQAKYCQELDSPFMVRLCTLFAEHLEPGNSVSHNLLNMADTQEFWNVALPLRIAGALHALVLKDQCKNLKRVYPPHHHSASDADLWQAVNHAMAEHADFIHPFLAHAPQTNEVRRCAALLPGFFTIAEKTGLPFTISELGASAGINQCWDSFAYQLDGQHWGELNNGIVLAPQWPGNPPPQPVNIKVAERAACDLKPVDFRDPGERFRLLSYIWADQEDRFILTDHALAFLEKCNYPVDAEDISSWLPKRLGRNTEGHVHVIYHTIVWGYQEEEAKIANRALIEKAGKKATESSPLAWLRLEPDGKDPGAAITLTLWPGGEEQSLGRADYHGRWVDWAG